MPAAIEQHQPTDRTGTAPQSHSEALQDVRQAAYGSGAAKPEQPDQSDVMKQFGDFCIGFGDGLSHFAQESVQAAGQAITHPGETIQNAVKGTGEAIKTTAEVATAGASYLASHVASGDYAGLANDAVHTGEAIGTGIAQSVDHFNHLSTEEKGYVFGHDVAPTVIATVVAPELMPEGEALAAAGKAVSSIGTLAKESGAAVKLAETFESTTSKMQAISQKLAAMSKKMEAMLDPKGVVKCVEEHEKEGFEHINPIKTPGKQASESFVTEVKEAHKHVEDWIVKHLEKEKVTTHVVEKIEQVFGDAHSRTPACFNPDNQLAPKGIYMAEKVWNEGEWKNNTDVLFRLHHELGHFINATLKTDWLSNEPGFMKAFAKDWSAISPKEPNALILGAKTAELRRDEVFADLFGHLKFESNSQYSQDMRRLFPNTMEHMIGRNGKW